MNVSANDDLIDESEIRAALQPLRFDRHAFAVGVRKRIDVATQSEQDSNQISMFKATDSRESDWLRIAASFVPIQLLGRNLGSSITPISFAAISVGKKLIVVLAFPFICFLMVGLTVLGMVRIRAAQNEQVDANFDIEEANRVTKQWWKRYGWIAVIVFAGTLSAPFLGWTTPLVIAFVSSGFAAVSLVLALAKENLIERSLIGGMCVAGLGLLGQASQSLTNLSSNSSQILDPNLVTGVLFGGAVFISFWVKPLAWTKSGDLQALAKYQREMLMIWLVINVAVLASLAYFLTSILPVIGIAFEVAIVAYGFSALQHQIVFGSSICRLAIRSIILLTLSLVCTQSYWRGVSESDIRKHVESFDGNYRLGTWDDWADAAKFLNKLGGFDKPVSLMHFQQDLERNPQTRGWMLSAATRSELLTDSELQSYVDRQIDRARLTDLSFADAPINYIQSEYTHIVALSASGELTGAEQSILAKRLMATWNQLGSSDFDYSRLRNSLWLTELFLRLAPEFEINQRTKDVHRWLVSHQVTKPPTFHIGGGFVASEQLRDSDRRTTVAAISLMEVYGVPTPLSISQLRSYLRPNFIYDFHAYDYVPKKLAREGLNRLPQLPRLSIVDYVQSESLLWLSILLVLLLAYATQSSPPRQDVYGM